MFFSYLFDLWEKYNNKITGLLVNGKRKNESKKYEEMKKTVINLLNHGVLASLQKNPCNLNLN